MARTRDQDNARKFFSTIEKNEIGKLPKPKDPKRRELCRGSLLEFIRAYCCGAGGFLKTPPSAKMEEIIEHLQTVVISGGRTHIRMARAHGKTCFIKCACVYALAYGFRRFIVAVSARSADASSMIEDLFALCEDGEQFGEDFPEIAVPIRKLGGVLQRAHNQTFQGKRTKIGKTAGRIILPTIKGSVSSGAIVVARGFKGAARGLVRGSLRPDLILFDDLQDDKAARNPRTVQQYDEMIEKNFLGLGGHDKQISAFMTSTPICPDDLSELYSEKSSWKTFTFPMVIKFPTCWRDEKHGLWGEYFAVRKDAVDYSDDVAAKCNEFYSEHQAEMDAGAEILNPGFYDHDTELSGVQHAMNLYFDNGEDAFWSEFQMKPVRKRDSFAITASTILSRVRPGVQQWFVPPETVYICAATDLNPAYGFTSAIVAFDRQQTGFVPWYGIHQTAISSELPETQRAMMIYNELVNFGRQFVSACKAAKCALSIWGVDAGYESDTVHRFAANAPSVIGAKPIAMYGRSNTQWRTNVRTQIQPDRNGTKICAEPANGRRWMLWNSDVHREAAQKAWLGEVGSPGGLSMFDGGMRHGDFASQIASETLEGKADIKGVTVYRWVQHGSRHDYGDAVAMCYALAANFGISAAGSITPVTQPKPNKSHYTRKFVTGF